MLSALLRRERMLVLAALLAVILLAWSYLLLGAGIEMEQMEMGGGQMMLMAPAWTASYAALIFLMWAIMMMAMMLPSAAPAVLLAAALMRQRGGDRIFGPTGLFVLGYLLIWFGFSLAATALQWGLDRAGLLSADMSSGAPFSRAIVDRGWSLSVDPAETGLPFPMPLALRAPHQILAPRPPWTDAGWCGARHVLSRLLLDADGVAVRRRLDERALDRRPCTPGLH